MARVVTTLESGRPKESEYGSLWLSQLYIPSLPLALSHFFFSSLFFTQITEDSKPRHKLLPIFHWFQSVSAIIASKLTQSQKAPSDLPGWKKRIQVANSKNLE